MFPAVGAVANVADTLPPVPSAAVCDCTYAIGPPPDVVTVNDDDDVPVPDGVVTEIVSLREREIQETRANIEVKSPLGVVTASGRSALS